jgi:hypothetical protein
LLRRLGMWFSMDPMIPSTLTKNLLKNGLANMPQLHCWARCVCYGQLGIMTFMANFPQCAHMFQLRRDDRKKKKLGWWKILLVMNGCMENIWTIFKR